MSQLASLIEYVVLFVTYFFGYFGPRSRCRFDRHWAAYLLEPGPRIQEKHRCYVSPRIYLSFTRSTIQPRPDKIRDSNRYSYLRDQLLTHVRQPMFEGYWICRGLNKTPIEPKDADLVIFYLHGGGYALGHPILDAPNLLLIAEGLTNEGLTKEGLTIAIFAPRYTLTPEGHLPQQIDKVASAYKWLVQDLGVSPHRVALIGESAGGHLALSFLLNQHLRGVQGGSLAGEVVKPGSAFFISPWWDLHSSNSKATNLRPGEGTFRQLLQKQGEFTLRGLDAPQRDMFLNFARRNDKRGSWRNILPSNTWISAGDDELIFVHDLVDFVSTTREDGAKITLEIEPGARHAW